ncbi:hypothetical protein BDV35DRAFT_384766 [Aspergillus flavus]|uniref:Uncharacterized protein n=1 Tax=Aspergillus flavus TaxID=5059 RepID=A0A5N6GI25_ASPFL|nr:hypothetical protein BDV35DRAFT_384766 [Aspergillus flavus]
MQHCPFTRHKKLDKDHTRTTEPSVKVKRARKRWQFVPVFDFGKNSNAETPTSQSLPETKTAARLITDSGRHRVATNTPTSYTISNRKIADTMVPYTNHPTRDNITALVMPPLKIENAFRLGLLSLAVVSWLTHSEILQNEETRDNALWEWGKVLSFGLYPHHPDNIGLQLESSDHI